MQQSLHSSTAISLCHWVISSCVVSFSRGRFWSCFLLLCNSDGVCEHLIAKEFGSKTELPIGTHQQCCSHHKHSSESFVNVGGIADPAPEKRNSPESREQLCSAPSQLIAMRRVGCSVKELDQSPFHCLGHMLGLTHWVKCSLFILCKG